jgi:transposase-like protein
MLAKDELVSILQRCIEVLDSSTEKQLGNTTQKIKDFLTQFQNLDGKCNIPPCQSFNQSVIKTPRCQSADQSLKVTS